MRVKNVKWIDRGGLATVDLDVDGAACTLYPQKPGILYGRGVAIVETPPGKADLFPPVDVAGDPEQGIADLTVEIGGTRDPVIVGVAKTFMQALKDQTWRPGNPL